MERVIRVFLVLLFSFLLFRVNLSFADEENIREEIKKLKERIAQLEEKLAKKEESQSFLEEFSKGLSINAGATFIIQATHNANGDSLSKKGEDVNDSSYSLDLEIEKEFSDYGKAYLHFEAGKGRNVTDELKLFSNVNADITGDEDFDLIEGYYEHYFKQVPLTLTFGKLDATCYIDTNEYANDETTQFLGETFKNSPTIEFPDDNGCGIRFLFSPLKYLEIETLMMDADADWEDLFDKVFISTQINFKPNIFLRPGNYRFFGWLNDKEHTKWKEENSTKNKGYGFGISFDQELTDNLGVFLRYAWQNPKVYMNGSDFSLEHSYSLGLQLLGGLWGREEDVLGIGFSQIFPSDEYKRLNNLRAESEKHLEVYYNFKVNKYLSLSPDLQVIWQPYGKDASNGEDTIVVGGLRAQVNF